MQSIFAAIREKLEVRMAMLLAVGGTTVLAVIAGTGVIVNGPQYP